MFVEDSLSVLRGVRCEIINSFAFFFFAMVEYAVHDRVVEDEFFVYLFNTVILFFLKIDLENFIVACGKFLNVRRVLLVNNASESEVVVASLIIVKIIGLE